MRKAFADTLLRLAQEDPKIVFLTGDLGFQVFDEFRARFGARYVNVGVAEAQLVCCAAGLAMEGWRPFVYSIASFATGRAFEQIRVSVSYPGLPIVVVGAGGGYTYANSGVTHHAVEDLALMSVLPGMTVVAPGDPGEVSALLPEVARLEGPSYFRVGRYGESVLKAEEPPRLGRLRRLASGRGVLVVSTGDMAVPTLEAARLLKAEGVELLVYHAHTVKPLDTETLDRLAKEVHTVVVIEEHVPRGGLADVVAAWRATRPEPLNFVRIGPPDALALGSYKRDELRRRLGMDAEGIARVCRGVWKSTRGGAVAS